MKKDRPRKLLVVKQQFTVSREFIQLKEKEEEIPEEDVEDVYLDGKEGKI